MLMLNDDRLLSRKERKARVPASDMTIYRWEKAGLFPKRISVGGRVFWRLSEILEWIEAQSKEV